MTKKRKRADTNKPNSQYYHSSYSSAHHGDANARHHNARTQSYGDSAQSGQGKIDPIFGQRGAIPGLDDSDQDIDNDDDSDEGGGRVSAEAIAYLRGVRSEASAIPFILVAPSHADLESVASSRNQDEGDVEDENDGYALMQQNKCYYQDGAYFSTTSTPYPEHQKSDLRKVYNASDQGLEYDDKTSSQALTQNQLENKPLNEDKGDDTIIGPIREDHSQNPSRNLLVLETLYHNNLLNRYHATRQKISLRSQQSQPLPDEVKDFPSQIPPYNHYHQHQQPEKRALLSAWDSIITTYNPSPSYLKLLDQEEVLSLIDICTSRLRRNKWTDGRGFAGMNLSKWVWGLFLVLGERGTLNSEEIAVIRDLGKRAGSVILGLEVEDNGAGGEESNRQMGEDGDLEGNEEGESEGDREAAEEQAPITAAEVEVRSTEVNEDVDAAESTPEQNRDAEEGDGKYDKGDEGKNEGDRETSLKATLDMILTIVGEAYGQLDLLIARGRLWKEDGI